MSTSRKGAPTGGTSELPISLDDLAHWGTKTLLKQAQEQRGCVVEQRWEPPILSGTVKDPLAPGGLFSPEVNLRSSTFIKTHCQCAKGMQGHACVHALALALAALATGPEQTKPQVIKKAPPVALEGTLRSLVVSASRGKPLSFALYLPPNLKAAAARGNISIKVEGFTEGTFFPLENLSRRQAFQIEPRDYALAVLIEGWCRGQLYSLLQLKPAQLLEALQLLKGAPCVFWSQAREQPISWEGDRLPGVHEALEPARTLAPSTAPLWTNPSRGLPGVSGFELHEPSANTFDTLLTVDGSLDALSVRLHSPEDTPQLISWLKNEAGLQLEPSNGRFWVRGRHKVLNFLAQHHKHLEAEHPGAFSPKLETLLKTLKSAQLQAHSKEVFGKLQLQIKLDAGDCDEATLHKALQSGCYYAQSSEGYYLFEPQSLAVLKKIQNALSGDPSQPLTPVFEKTLAAQDLTDAYTLLEPLMEHWQGSEAWQKQGRALNQIDSLELPALSPALLELLRPYQRLGVAWLWHLYTHGLAGVLADEMGLGKTVQALGLAEALFLKNPHSEPILVVCPASLTENWHRETARFAKNLKHFVHHGSQRLLSPQDAQGYSVVITSYGTLARDHEVFQKMRWSLIIADEAQHIKNRNTLNAKALRTLKAQSRFVLTGTPMENSFEDLSSLFEFLMPGYLAQPTGNPSREDKAWFEQRQREQAAPYVLRRSKAKVAPELPKKIEQTLFCTLEPKQEALYQEVLARTRQEISELERSGASHGKVYMAALTQLLRLRQICAEPRLLDKTLSAQDSAKFRALKELIEEAMDDQHRLLVFSQFASLLRILAKDLEALGIPYSYLDGQTKNRQEVCDTFNNDPGIPVFLISLKAGGVGLNLTGADTVVFCDPWWNPAAEAQAMDRAHRIGQERNVTSIKLIAAHSVEEKVLELQLKKRSLLEDLFSSSEAANAKLALQEVKSLLGEAVEEV